MRRDSIFIFIFEPKQINNIVWVKYKYHAGNWNSAPSVKILYTDKYEKNFSDGLLNKIERVLISYHEKPKMLTDEEKDQC